MNTKKRVTAIVTVYRLNAHADVIVSRLFGELGHEPQVELVSLFTDQVPDNDMSRELAARHGVAICDTIEQAVSFGAPEQPIDGIVVIGEHGEYPWNEKRQHLYPRLRFMQETLAAMDKHGIRAPIFLDKHFSCDDAAARWIYDEVKRRGIALMAGSSIPYAPSLPDYDPAVLRGARDLFVVSHGGLESYGFHAMEVMQRLAERRAGAETGVASVMALEGEAMWEAMERGEWPEELMLRALAALPETPDGHPRGRCADPALFVVAYKDGTMGYVAQLHGFVSRWSYAVRAADGTVTAAYCNTDTGRPYRHFETLTCMIEEMVMTGKPPCAVERHLLTTHMINAAMESLYAKRPIAIPELSVEYYPANEQSPD